MQIDDTIKDITMCVARGVEGIAAFIIAVAVLQVVFSYITNIVKPVFRKTNEEIRLKFGSYAAVSLELLLGADILSTAVAPSWDDIGKLAAIAVIRTGLNYFLERELSKAEQRNSERI